MKSYFKYILLVLMLMVPAISFAVTINPPGGNAWDMYVYGNARALFNILEGVKMLMVPDAGSTGFITLLLMLATIGFIVLAIGAGFDPGRNLMRMFTYIFVVYFVVFSTTSLKVNVNITDMIRDSSGTQSAYTVSNAPALVVLPAALTTEIGRYFTRSIEAFFVMPAEFKLAGMGGGGQFNLFGKIMKESSEYVITSSELKKSLASYSSDCVIPAIAMGNLEGTAYNSSSKQMEPVYGVDALLRTANVSQTLKSASHNSVMTKYYPVNDQDNKWRSVLNAYNDNTTDASSFTTKKAAALGVVVSCANASDLLFDENEGAVAKYANLLYTQGADSWAKTGINVPFEALMSATIAPLNAGDSAYGYSKPTGMIMQQALINTMKGTFQQSAIQAGNNEAIQAAMISQAEASQRSSWVSAALVFNNMMGYIYVTLQAFIFALTPIIVVALLVPGLGKSIFVNYAQILIWLMLWQPMLALINYLITVFGTDSISSIISADGGLSANNKYLISAKTNDMMIAAGFLGSMVPLIAWGLVKGTLAFTEFITAGIGSSFATQAGAAAATGNVSLNNMSMDNASMNKFSTVMSSAVGAQQVMSYVGAGSMGTKFEMGGVSTDRNLSAATLTVGASAQTSRALAEASQFSSMLSNMASNGVSATLQEMQSKGHQWTAAEAAAIHRIASQQSVLQSADSTSGGGRSTSESTNLGNNAAHQQGSGSGTNVGGELGLGAGTPKPGGLFGGIINLKAGMNAGFDFNSNINDSISNTAGNSIQATNAGAQYTTGATSNSNSGTLGSSVDHSKSSVEADLATIQRAASHGYNFSSIQSEAEQASKAINEQIAFQTGNSISSQNALGVTPFEAFAQERDSISNFNELAHKVQTATASLEADSDRIAKQVGGKIDESNKHLVNIPNAAVIESGSRPIVSAPAGFNHESNEIQKNVDATRADALDTQVKNKEQADKSADKINKDSQSQVNNTGNDANQSASGRMVKTGAEKIKKAGDNSLITPRKNPMSL